MKLPKFAEKGMDQTHLHLLITHLPIFGSILGCVILVQGLFTNSEQTKIAAYNLLIISSLGACIAYLTGESAEETIENIAGVSENMIEEHEDSARTALIALIILGISSLSGIVLTLKKYFSGPVSIIILLLSLASFAIVARTGYLGGQIRHTEIRTSQTGGNQVEQTGEQDNDD